MYQEVFVLVAVNLGEASGDRDIDFSLNPNRLLLFRFADIFDNIQLFRSINKTKHFHIRAISTTRFVFTSHEQNEWQLSRPNLRLPLAEKR